MSTTYTTEWVGSCAEHRHSISSYLEPLVVYLCNLDTCLKYLNVFLKVITANTGYFNNRYDFVMFDKCDGELKQTVFASYSVEYKIHFSQWIEIINAELYTYTIA